MSHHTVVEVGLSHSRTHALSRKQFLSPAGSEGGRSRVYFPRSEQVYTIANKRIFTRDPRGSAFKLVPFEPPGAAGREAHQERGERQGRRSRTREDVGGGSSVAVHPAPPS